MRNKWLPRAGRADSRRPPVRSAGQHLDAGATWGGREAGEEGGDGIGRGFECHVWEFELQSELALIGCFGWACESAALGSLWSAVAWPPLQLVP